jgi:glycerol uptake facilitator-like aquaporin
MTFTELRLIKPLLQSLDKKGYTQPTPIQEKAIPAVLAGKDIFGCAQTGTGKTAAFALPLLQTSTHLRDGPAQWLAETIATFGLLLTIAGAARFKPDGIPLLVGLYITGAYWFTASTSFANPAVTVARMLTDSFSGIAPGSAPGFIAAQLIATVAALRLLPWLFQARA